MLVLCAALAAPLAAQITETQRLVGHNDQFQDFFGAATAASDGWLFVGAYAEPAHHHSQGPGWGGVVYVYQREVTGWVHTQILESPSATTGAFGRKLAVSGDVLVVGDTVDNWFASGAGKAHVFELSDGRWVFRQELVSRTPGAEHGFGGWVDVDGDRIIVSESGEDSLELGYDNGAVSVFERGPGGWTRTAVLLAEDRPNQDPVAAGFNQVALCGDRIAVQAWFKNPHVQIFELGPNGWENTAFLIQPDSSFKDFFGNTLALDGNWLAVGAPASAGGFFPLVGKVTMFEFTGVGGSNGWHLRQTLIASNASAAGNPANTDSFGFSADLQGERLLVGARYGLSGADIPYGQAYLFELDSNNQWVETLRFSTEAAENGQPEGAAFGQDVALQDSVVLVGAYADFGRSGTERSGAAYVYELPLGESTCPGVANSTGEGSSLTLTGVAKAGLNGVDATGEDLPPGAPGVLLASPWGGPPFGHPFTPPGSQGTLCLGGTPKRLGHTTGPASPAGTWSAPLDLPQASIVVQPGDTWNFQLWYRDSNPTPTSNFSNSVRVTWH
jgi:FG-GAP repeat